MNQQNNGITSSLNNNQEETAHRYRDTVIFWEAMAQIEIDAVYASQLSRLLEMIANQ